MEAFDLMFEDDELSNLNYCDISTNQQFFKSNEIHHELNKN